MTDTEEARWDALRAEMSEPVPGVSTLYGNSDVVEREPEKPDPFAAFKDEIRTSIPEGEEVRSDDVFEWHSEDGGYYEWRRRDAA